MYRMKPENHNKGLFYHPSPRQLRGGSLIDDSGVNYGKDTSTKNLKASSDFAEQYKTALSDIDIEMPTLKSGSKKDRDLYRQQMAIYNKKVKDKEKGFHKQYKSEIMGNLDEQFLQAGYTKDKNGRWTKPASISDVPWLDKAIGWIPNATDFANRAISAGEKVYNKPNLENIMNAGQTLADSAMAGYNMGKQLADPKKLIKDIAIQQGKKALGMGLPKDYNKIDNHYNGHKKRKLQGKGINEKNIFTYEEEKDFEKPIENYEMYIEPILDLYLQDKEEDEEKRKDNLDLLHLIMKREEITNDDLNNFTEDPKEWLKLNADWIKDNVFKHPENKDKIDKLIVRIKDKTDRNETEILNDLENDLEDIKENDKIKNILDKTLGKSKAKKEAVAKAKEEAKKKEIARDKAVAKAVVVSEAKAKTLDKIKTLDTAEFKNKAKAKAEARAKAKTDAELKALEDELDINKSSKKGKINVVDESKNIIIINRDEPKIDLQQIKYGSQYEIFKVAEDNLNTNDVTLQTKVKGEADSQYVDGYYILNDKGEYIQINKGNSEYFMIDAIQIENDKNDKTLKKSLEYKYYVGFYKVVNGKIIKFMDDGYVDSSSGEAFYLKDDINGFFVQCGKLEGNGYTSVLYKEIDGKYKPDSYYDKQSGQLIYAKKNNFYIPLKSPDEFEITTAYKKGNKIAEHSLNMSDEMLKYCNMIPVNKNDPNTLYKAVVKDEFKLSKRKPKLEDYDFDDNKYNIALEKFKRLYNFELGEMGNIDRCNNWFLLKYN